MEWIEDQGLNQELEDYQKCGISREQMCVHESVGGGHICGGIKKKKI